MFATIRSYQEKSGNTEELFRRIQQGLIPMLTIQRGFVSYYAIDAGNDIAISVSIYADRAAPRQPISPLRRGSNRTSATSLCLLTSPSARYAHRRPRSRVAEAKTLPHGDAIESWFSVSP